ncbi:hypothetical protein ERO13_D07G179866v2 [Gossypium hirsutum]|nr:hypothetical protein ERO13_D07G179866v2 [Gossypium hirsutum]
MKVVSCVRGELLSIVGLYGRISWGPERRWFTLWRMSAVRVHLSIQTFLSLGTNNNLFQIFYKVQNWF